MLDGQANKLNIVNDLPTDNKGIVDSMDGEMKELAKQQQEDEERVLDFSDQELEKSREEIQKKAEPAYKFANELITAIDLDKNPDFSRKREEKYQEIKNDPKHSWESDLGKRTSAFALVWNETKKNGEIISDDEITDDTVDKAVRYMMALGDATEAAEKLAVFNSQKSMYEGVVSGSSMEQRESAIAVA